MADVLVTSPIAVAALGSIKYQQMPPSVTVSAKLKSFQRQIFVPYYCIDLSDESVICSSRIWVHTNLAEIKI